MQKMIFVNLPVKDLAAATRFYEAIGCTRNPQFSDEKASSMVWEENITFQLLSRDYFATFTPKPVADAKTGTEVLLALSCESRKQVDDLAERAVAAGGNAGLRDPQDYGFLYNRAVEDPDGHVLELAWMDPTGMPAEEAA